MLRVILKVGIMDKSLSKNKENCPSGTLHHFLKFVVNLLDPLKNTENAEGAAAEGRRPLWGRPEAALCLIER